MKKNMITITLLAMLPVFNNCTAQESAQKEQQVLQALNETATYITDVLINEEGYSRCDYNIPEGRWYDYEPPWHTGQAIYALTEAHRITGKKEYLE